MRFEWDPVKNRRNIRKHGLDFTDGKELFLGDGPFLVAAELQEEYGEERWRGIGTIRGRVVVAVFTEPKQGVIRFISIRKANREERKLYEEAIENELGPRGSNA